jgi:molybdate transport system substrate-binding protein
MRVAQFFLVLVFASCASGQEITVAAAADLHSALDEIASHFQTTSSFRVKVIYESSGSIYEQIQNGAPFDMFFSANVEYPKKLQQAGLVVAGSYYEFARGKLVLLVRSGSPLDLHRGLQVLLDTAVKKIAIADPAHAPYGQAAVAALRSQKLYDRVSGKIVAGENVSQAASFVLSGAADIGILPMSLALIPSSRGQVRFEEIPESEYPPILQACVVLKSSKMSKEALQFETYVKGTEAIAILRKYGFEVPASPQPKSIQ